MNPQELFDAVVSRLGIAMILGPGTLKRSLSEAGIDWRVASKKQYIRALVPLEARLCSYMPPAEARERIAQIELFLRE
jgi:hypothetical protein